MKRKGEKATNRLKFSEEEMRQAVLRIVEAGDSLNSVAQEVGLCKKTLKSYLDKYSSTATEKKGEFAFRPNYEINQVFTHQLEKVFEEYLISVDRGVQPINRAYVRRAAFEFALNCNVHVPKTWNVRKAAGLDWMYGFLNRHPLVKRAVIVNKAAKSAKNNPVLFVSEGYAAEETEEEVITPDDVDVAIAGIPYSSASAALQSELDSIGFHSLDVPVSEYHPEINRNADLSDSTNPNLSAALSSGIGERHLKTAIEEFEDNLREAYCAISQDGHVPSDRVYNMDEIALVVENPGAEVPQVVLTACCCARADGYVLPPFVIFPRAEMRSSLFRGYEPGVCGVASVDGVVDDRLFALALRHFGDVAHASQRRKVALIVDDAEHHVTIETIDYCRERGIELVTLPPQSAGLLQPLERHVFKTLKAHFNSTCADFRAANAEYPVSVHDVSTLFNVIRPHAFTVENVVLGFNETGLYPLDEMTFAEMDAQPTRLVNEEAPLPVAQLEHRIALVPSDVRSEDTSSDDETGAGSRLTKYERRLAECFEESPLDEYFNGLAFGLDELQAHGGIAPDRVYNMDEIELVVRMDEDESKLRLVCCCAVNAAGASVPPFFVYPSGQPPLECGIEGARACTVDQFEREDQIFAAMLAHFVERVAPTPLNRVLLVVDDDHCHVTVGTIDLCAENGIVLVSVPAHTRQPLQPLEKLLFKQLTVDFAGECNRFTEKHAERPLTMADMVASLMKVYKKVFEAKAIRASFQQVGIWPLSEERINAAARS